MDKSIQLESLINFTRSIIELTGQPHSIEIKRSRFILHGRFGCATKCTYTEMNEKLNGIWHTAKFYNQSKPCQN